MTFWRSRSHRPRSFFGCWLVALAVVAIFVCLIGAMCSPAHAIDRSRPVVGGLSTPGRTGADLKTLPIPLPAVMHRQPLALLVFSADWCGPCKQQMPALRSLGLPIYRYDADESPQAVKTYRVKGLPTVLVGIYGREVARVTGAKPQRWWAIRAKVWRVRAGREAETRRRVQ